MSRFAVARTLALVVALGASAASRDAAAKDTPAKAACAKDVEFLLTQLEKKAGALIRLKEIDWAKVAAQFRAEAKKVDDDVGELKLCVRLMARLRDGHAGVIDSKVKWPDESKGRRFTGPRVHLLTEGKKVWVRAAFGEAERRGVRVGMEVVQIDGRPAMTWLLAKKEELRDTQGFSTDHQALYAACHQGLADWSGTSVKFALVDGDGQKSVTIERDGGPNYAPFGPVFFPKDLKTIEKSRLSYGRTAGGFGYVHLREVPSDLPDELDTALEAIGDVPGMILDCRANSGGGCDHEAVFGRFLPQGKKWRQYVGQGKRPFVGRMVVIIDAGVCSAGETIAGQFGEDGRAYVIGDGPTAGMSSQKEELTVPSGLVKVRFSVASNKGRFNGGKGIEGLGVPPMERVPYDPKELGSGVDTQIRRAEELLRGGFPKGTVAFEEK